MQRKPASRTGGDHLPPQERPGRLAVEEHDRVAFALVEVGEPQPFDFPVVGLPREVREALERAFGRAHGVGHLGAEHTRRRIG